MSIIVIQGRRLDTDKAKRKWTLSRFDGKNLLRGELYLSSRGTWYVSTPSQFANGHRWELVDPADAVERYHDFLSDKERAEILNLALLETE